MSASVCFVNYDGAKVPDIASHRTLQDDFATFETQRETGLTRLKDGKTHMFPREGAHTDKIGEQTLTEREVVETVTTAPYDGFWPWADYCKVPGAHARGGWRLHGIVVLATVVAGAISVGMLV